MTVTTPLLFRDVQLNESAATTVTLEVSAHRTVSVVGEEDSGVGRLVTYALGLNQPPRGQALVYGEDIALMPRRAALAFRRRVGYLPAGDGLLQNLSLRDNIGLPLRFGSDLSEPKLPALSDSISATLSQTRALLEHLNQVASNANTLATENRTTIRQTLDHLHRSSQMMDHFIDQVSRRPVRMLTGVKNPKIEADGVQP